MMAIGATADATRARAQQVDTLQSPSLIPLLVSDTPMESSTNHHDPKARQIGGACRIVQTNQFIACPIETI